MFCHKPATSLYFVESILINYNEFAGIMYMQITVIGLLEMRIFLLWPG